MSKLRVVTWNAEGMFVEGTKTRRATPHDALATLKKLDADIVVVPEFGRLADLRDEIKTAIHALGYELAMMAYDEPRIPGLGFAIMSRLPITAEREHPLGDTTRSILEVHCQDTNDKTIRVLGLHFDDRAEATRMLQAAQAVAIIDQSPTARTLLLGDFNAMHISSKLSRLLRSRAAIRLAWLLPRGIFRDSAISACDLAAGTTIDYVIANTSLRDLDPGRQRTISGKQAGLEWLPAIRVAKIDWIFGTHHFRTRSYRVLPDVGSDHRPVLAELEY